MDTRGVSVSEIEITEKTPSKTELRQALKQHGKRSVFNTSGVKYRELGLSSKLDSMSDQEAVDLLSSDGKLIKRPFLVVDKEHTVLGFKKDEWKKL